MAGVETVVHTLHGLAFHPYQARWKNALYIGSRGSPLPGATSSSP
jgi:hypothetical protein